MRFVWFWTFWHWSDESFRSGSLLRGPVHGIGSHWDEWFRHEASPDDRAAVAEVGRTTAAQRRFVAWLARHWAREAVWRGEHPSARFVLAQLAHVPPFDRWAALARYRVGYGAPGVAAIVLAGDSLGESADVRTVEALALPRDADGTAPIVVAEGFEPAGSELGAARRAALDLLGGRGLLVFLTLWLAVGRRPYPRWLAAALAAGWVAVAAIVVRLVAGPEPGGRLLVGLAAALVALWGALVLTATLVAGALGVRAWRLGREWARRLAAGQLRVRMNGGLRLQGGSAGLAFCLNTLLAAYRAEPRLARRSWLWRRFFTRLRSEGTGWAATGVITERGRVEPVVLEPKLRASLRHAGVRHILTPRQRGAGQQAVDRLAGTLAPADAAPAVPGASGALAPHVRLGFAAEHRLRAHRCRHVAQSVMAVGDFASRRQAALNAFAGVVSLAMVVALPDLRGILLPPPAPAVVAPSSPSPYYLWVSLDTRSPEHFAVELESQFWSNRRVNVAAYGGADASVRAEMRLTRIGRRGTSDVEEGTVWVERRRRFLTREFASGERVGRYSLSYLTRLPRD